MRAMQYILTYTYILHTQATHAVIQREEAIKKLATAKRLPTANKVLYVCVYVCMYVCMYDLYVCMICTYDLCV